MSDFIPNSFQVPNVVIDVLAGHVSAKSLACFMFIIRKTRGWNKESDRIPFTQFKSFLLIKDKRTVHRILTELEDLQVISVYREVGKINEYSLGPAIENPDILGTLIDTSLSTKYPQLGTKNVGTKNVTSNKKCTPLGTKNVPTTRYKKCTSSKDTTKTTNQKQSACDLFIEKFPAKIKAKEIRQKWGKLDKNNQLTDRIFQIIEDISKRLQKDRKWIAGYYPDPIDYLWGERWNDEIVPAKQSDVGFHQEDWKNIPKSDDYLNFWAKKHNYSNPRPGEYFPQYRQRLLQEIEQRIKTEQIAL